MLHHPKLGANPRDTFCTLCGTPTGVVPLGLANYIDTCTKCHALHVAGAPAGTCQNCGHKVLQRRDLAPGEKVPGGWCTDCQAAQAECAHAVADGGIYWRCATCKAEGAITKENPAAALARQQAGIQAPEPFGVLVDKCPLCEQADLAGGGIAWCSETCGHGGTVAHDHPLALHARQQGSDYTEGRRLYVEQADCPLCTKEQDQ